MKRLKSPKQKPPAVGAVAVKGKNQRGFCKAVEDFTIHTSGRQRSAVGFRRLSRYIPEALSAINDATDLPEAA